MADGLGDHPTLEQDFNECEFVVDKLEESSDAVPNEQIAKTIEKLEGLQNIMTSSDFVSANDCLEDFSSQTMKLLLTEVYLGRVMENVHAHDRLKQLQKVKGLYNGYLVTAEVYGFSPLNEGLPRDAVDRTSTQGLIADAVISRNRKLQLLGMEDDLKREVDTLKVQKNPDDATLRNLYEKKLRLWCLRAVRFTEMINREIELLKFRNEMSDADRAELSKRPEVTPLKTMFIPKRETEQKQVYGLGYPSIPTQTVDEWYDQQVSSGRFKTEKPVTITGNEGNERESENEDFESEADRDRKDEEQRQKDMRMDEYKDTHPRGWGNMYGKG
ncbi:unnamed protein product [Bursaphelenchus xylophilus]|uniref:(pine wood nematode) hypothetical protein n=1 Tax=Bursaphelenchus xylophilus TaxID=6326 RepID=A0A1I7RRS5_BURXY|nr:unnamed protein product [Bursaphelenchus xylophilus]CAG9123506.1 unnamed protein product [Bursaphelenchus xylophilus]